MQFKAGIEEYFAQYRGIFKLDFYDYPIPEQRQMYHTAILSLPGCSRPPNVRVTDEFVTADGRDISMRIYRVSEAPGQPCLILAHGGGFVLGSIATYDTFAAELAAKASVTVVAVDFRLAPEHSYPAGLEDLYSVLSALATTPAQYGIDPDRIGITGDSSGGTFSAALSLLARDRARAQGAGPRLRAQIPLNGVFDMHRWLTIPADQMDQWFPREMLFFSTAYLGTHTELQKPYASPLLASDFSDLPAAYIMTPEHDDLRPDSEMYASRLRAAGVPVDLVIEPGMCHGCLRARGMSPPAYEVFERVCHGIKRLLTLSTGPTA